MFDIPENWIKDEQYYEIVEQDHFSMYLSLLKDTKNIDGFKRIFCIRENENFIFDIELNISEKHIAKSELVKIIEKTFSIPVIIYIDK